jgi:hypothetical protein
VAIGAELGPDWKAIAAWLGWILSGLLSALGARIWNQMHELQKEIRSNLVTREEFERVNSETKAERDRKHTENTGHFESVESRLTVMSDRHWSANVTLEKRLGEITTAIAQIPKTQPRQEGPERRRGY